MSVPQKPKRTIDVYLQLGRAVNGWPAREKMTLVGATLTPPTSRRPNTVLVKVRVLVPDEAFDPAAIPALVADIPLELLHPAQGEIAVEVEDASDPDV